MVTGQLHVRDWRLASKAAPVCAAAVAAVATPLTPDEPVFPSAVSSCCRESSKAFTCGCKSADAAAFTACRLAFTVANALCRADVPFLTSTLVRLWIEFLNSSRAEHTAALAVAAVDVAGADAVVVAEVAGLVVAVDVADEGDELSLPHAPRRASPTTVSRAGRGMWILLASSSHVSPPRRIVHRG
jgi:hypothetical protein